MGRTNPPAKTSKGIDPVPHKTIFQEFLRQQLPVIVGIALCGFLSAYLEYGYLPGGQRPFPVAGVAVPVWHLVWLGVWTGYTMALVGQAAGIFALPYSTSVLQFTNPHVTPTMLVLTVINPLGALLGFRRSGQWNLDFAAAVCAGGIAGGLIGPFARATVLANADTFRLTLGLALAVFGVHLFQKAIVDYRRFGRILGTSFIDTNAPADDKRPRKQFAIKTTFRSFRRVAIRFGAEERSLSNISLFLIGAGVGIFSSALGVGGGFLLVPIFATVYRIPLYIMVAATIPYTVALSLAGVLTFTLLLPLLGTPAIAPEWSWGFFTAAGGVFGSWWASKTQAQVPQHFLGLMLGGATAAAGILYVMSAVITLPFKI